MKISERQEQILDRIVNDYIDLAQPISSEFLEKKHNFGICPATIRIEMQKLTDKRYLYQPHTSAGRIPTDKGFRFFVDRLIEKESSEFLDKEFLKEIQKMERQIKDSLKFFQDVTRSLASVSSNLAISYLFDEKIFWKEGWQGVFEEPEFEDEECVKNFFRTIQDFEKNIEDFVSDNGYLPGVKVYIGKENPIPKSKDFSLIISQSKLPKKKKATLAILGPKRMGYRKNIALINSLVKILSNC